MHRPLAAAAAVALVLAACSGRPTPKSEIPFAAGSWPVAGAAPCAQDAAGRNRPAIKRIVAVDERTVRFELCAPDPAFVQKLAVPNLAVHDSGWLKAAIADGSIASSENGTGPYALESWQRGAQMVFVRNNDYWGSAAKAERLVVQFEAESAARVLQLRAGSVDGVDNVAATDAESLRNDATVALVPRAGFNTFYVNMNNRFAPFDDVRVRRAIGMALDRQRIVDLFYPQGSTLATHVPPCVIPLACGGADWYARDVAGAKALLAEAGFPNGFATTLSFRETPRAYLPNPRDVATDIQAQLAEIGVRVTLDVQEAGSYLDNLLSGKLQGLSFSAALPDYPEAWNALGIDFGAESGPTHGDRYPTIVALLDAAQAAMGDTARAAAFAALNDEIRSLVPVVPIANGASYVAFKGDVTGAHTSPLAAEQFAVMDPAGRKKFVWLQGAEPAGIYCMDEVDRDTTRLCAQFDEGLYGYVVGSTVAEPRLATGCVASDNGATYTCTLRSGVRFHNGARLDAADVLDSFAAAWDCAHPLHVGRTNAFRGWGWIMGNINTDRCANP